MKLFNLFLFMCYLNCTTCRQKIRKIVINLWVKFICIHVYNILSNEIGFNCKKDLFFFLGNFLELDVNRWAWLSMWFNRNRVLVGTIALSIRVIYSLCSICILYYICPRIYLQFETLRVRSCARIAWPMISNLSESYSSDFQFPNIFVWIFNVCVT